jgi:hypothetical protein
VARIYCRNDNEIGRNVVKKLQGLALGTLLMLGATSTAWAAGNGARAPVAHEAIEEIIITAKRVPPPEVMEEIIITAKRLPPEPIEEIVITAKRTAITDQARTPPVMAIELPSMEFAVAAPSVVKL